MPDSSMTKTASVMSTNENEKDKNTRIDLGDVTPHNIKLLKKVNQVVFPIVYHDKFYKDVLEAGELAKLAYYNDVVGKFVEYLWITFWSNANFPKFELSKFELPKEIIVIK